MYHYEILRMKCEFARDDNNTIWFIYASEIWARPNLVAKKKAQDEMDVMKKLKKIEREKHHKNFHFDVSTLNHEKVKKLE